MTESTCEARGARTIADGDTVKLVLVGTIEPIRSVSESPPLDPQEQSRGLESFRQPAPEHTRTVGPHKNITVRVIKHLHHTRSCQAVIEDIPRFAAVERCKNACTISIPQEEHIPPRGEGERVGVSAPGHAAVHVRPGRAKVRGTENFRRDISSVVRAVGMNTPQNCGSRLRDCRP